MPLVLGNYKLGDIHHWSLRNGPDCPGKTRLCSHFCYAARGSFMHRNVQQSHQVNRMLTDSKDFVRWMNSELSNKKVELLRIHADGDFYNSTYTRKWLKICRDNPHITFYAYTRSWRVPLIKQVLAQLAKLKNVSLWFSLDRQTGFPKRKPRSVKLAYMQVADDDLPEHKVDLVFRVHALRKKVVKKVSSRSGRSKAMVCPPENGVTKLTCEKCKFCFRSALDRPLRKMVELPMIASV